MAQYVILGVLKLTEDLPASQSAGIKGAPATTLSPYYIFNRDLSRSSQLSFYRLHVKITIISLTISTVLAILLILLSTTFHLSVLCYILV